MTGTLHPVPTGTLEAVDDVDDGELEEYTVCDRCGEETPVIDTSTGLQSWSEWVGATLCPDCWAEVQDTETNGLLSNFRAAGDRLLASEKRMAFLQDIDGIDADGIKLLLDILRTARGLQTPKETATFFQTILGTLQTYADIEATAPIIARAATAHSTPVWPEPTTPEPELEDLTEWMDDEGGCPATDGCWVEPDGTCRHDHPSWLLRLGYI